MSAGYGYKNELNQIAVLIDLLLYKNVANYLFKICTLLFLNNETSFFLMVRGIFEVEDFPRFSYLYDFYKSLDIADCGI